MTLQILERKSNGVDLWPDYLKAACKSAACIYITLPTVLALHWASRIQVADHNEHGEKMLLILLLVYSVATFHKQ